MKYWYIVLFCTTMTYGGGPSLLHNRTVQRNAKQSLDVLLSEIGVISLEDALEKVRRLPELLNMLRVPTVADAFHVFHERGTQEQVIALLNETGASNLADAIIQIKTTQKQIATLMIDTRRTSLADIITQVKGLPDLLSLLQVSTASQAQKKIVSLTNEVALLQQKNATLEAKYNEVVNRCKTIEKEFCKIGKCN